MPWRDLLPDYGGWSNTHRRVIRRRDKGVWEKSLKILIDEPDYEWLMIDGSHCKAHPHVARAKGGHQDMNRTKGGLTPRYLWPWMRMVCPFRVLITQGSREDFTQAGRLIEGFNAAHLRAGRGYDHDALPKQAKDQDMDPVIPPKKSRTVQRNCDKDLYKVRHLVENAFLHLKRWRSVKIRYAKKTASLRAAVHIRCIVFWIGIS